MRIVVIGAVALQFLLLGALQGCAGPSADAPQQASKDEGEYRTGSRIPRRNKAPTPGVTVTDSSALNGADAQSQVRTNR